MRFHVNNLQNIKRFIEAVIHGPEGLNSILLIIATEQLWNT